jgi:hypothetical protein
VFYATTSVWLNANRGDEAYANQILECLINECPRIVPAKSNIHSVLMSGDDADYLFVDCNGNQDIAEIHLHDSYRSSKVIWGDAIILLKDRQMTINQPSQMILKLERLNHA